MLEEAEDVLGGFEDGAEGAYIRQLLDRKVHPLVAMHEMSRMVLCKLGSRCVLVKCCRCCTAHGAAAALTSTTQGPLHSSLAPLTYPQESVPLSVEVRVAGELITMLRLFVC